LCRLLYVYIYTNELLMANIEKAIKLKKELDALRPLKEEDEKRILQKFRLDWNYHSNHLEGNSLTYGETKALILFGITAQGKPLKDHFEITGHNEAVNWVVDIVKRKTPLTEKFIRELHKLILKNPYEVDAITPAGKPSKKKINIGQYKEIPNHVITSTGEKFYFASPEETPAKMHDLVQWYSEQIKKTDLNPILLAARFHYKFIRIHPFDDGNGRSARILMNFILMQFDYPPVIIKTEDKENYFSVLRQADADIIEPFIEYIADNLNRSLDIMISGAKGESIEEPDDIDKEIALLEQKLDNISKPIEFSKSKASVLAIFNHSIAKLINKFKEKGKLLEKFYIDSSCMIFINDSNSWVNQGLIVRSKINEDIHNVILLYEYKNFNRPEVNAPNITSKIKVEFNVTQYEVRNVDGLKYQKLYSEQLTEEEITNIVNSEIRIHKEKIESLLKRE